MCFASNNLGRSRASAGRFWSDSDRCWSRSGQVGRFREKMVNAKSILVVSPRCRPKIDLTQAKCGRIRDNFGRCRTDSGRFRANSGRVRQMWGANLAKFGPSLGRIRANFGRIWFPARSGRNWPRRIDPSCVELASPSSKEIWPIRPRAMSTGVGPTSAKIDLCFKNVRGSRSGTLLEQRRSDIVVVRRHQHFSTSGSGGWWHVGTTELHCCWAPGASKSSPPPPRGEKHPT